MWSKALIPVALVTAEKVSLVDLLDTSHPLLNGERRDSRLQQKFTAHVLLWEVSCDGI